MERPEYEKYRYAKRRLLPVAYIDAQNKYIDHIESENKSLKENLQAIANATGDSKTIFGQSIYLIAVKHLKK